MSLEYQNRINGNGNGHSQTPTEETNPGKPKLDERFISNIQGKEFVLWAGLLDLAHQYGLIKLEVEHIQLPSNENGSVAICKATATTKDGKVFSDIADASPVNVNKKIALHILRMASTRAKARALRDMTNVGMCCLEELGDLDEVLEEDKPRRGRPPKSEIPPAPKEEKPQSTVTTLPHAQSNAQNNAPEGYLPKISEAQKRAIINIGRRHGMNENDLTTLAQERFAQPLQELSSRDASNLIRYLQNAS